MSNQEKTKSIILTFTSNLTTNDCYNLLINVYNIPREKIYLLIEDKEGNFFKIDNINILTIESLNENDNILDIEDETTFSI